MERLSVEVVCDEHGVGIISLFRDLCWAYSKAIESVAFVARCRSFAIILLDISGILCGDVDCLCRSCDDFGCSEIRGFNTRNVATFSALC